MRLLIIFFLVAVAVIGCKSNDKKVELVSNADKIDSTKFTTIQWLDSTNKNFGKIAEGQKLAVSFRFKNAGDKPLVIRRVQPSCGCTIAEQPNEPVAPGNEGVIKASFNSEGRVGTNHKTIFVFANTKGTQNNELQFEVEVEKKKW